MAQTKAQLQAELQQAHATIANLEERLSVALSLSCDGPHSDLARQLESAEASLAFYRGGKAKVNDVITVMAGRMRDIQQEGSAVVAAQADRNLSNLASMNIAQQLWPYIKPQICGRCWERAATQEPNDIVGRLTGECEGRCILAFRGKRVKNLLAEIVGGHGDGSLGQVTATEFRERLASWAERTEKEASAVH